mmetsp:Transcript_18641/g.46534  ORF Transcript_18641/g.46534 Transcript_18641/m.46534 type:complete len:168 (-) Transcript_18641:720-1223(-)|eukprot:CAMPEP_0178989844 /NCGR_PEP_ID=MMETSP0795-20121207/4603_1 /TAXON_ID=88552 /ORGANISM="Amoebophrya sp., Strain Ameob2" /LENGTH=167 /DNA_ID=CAMNT_0020681297 /DNA_START=79 /DNA_END=582 /DNA_ORIENTATION=+
MSTTTTARLLATAAVVAGPTPRLQLLSGVAAANNDKLVLRTAEPRGQSSTSFETRDTDEYSESVTDEAGDSASSNAQQGAVERKSWSKKQEQVLETRSGKMKGSLLEKRCTAGGSAQDVGHFTREPDLTRSQREEVARLELQAERTSDAEAADERPLDEEEHTEEAE